MFLAGGIVKPISLFVCLERLSEGVEDMAPVSGRGRKEKKQRVFVVRSSDNTFQ